MSETRWGPTIREVGEDEGDVYVIGVLESKADDAWSLLFMSCPDDEAEQEGDLGMDTYCLVVDPGQSTCYGGVEECEVGETTLRLKLADVAAATLGIPAEPVLPLELTPSQMEMLRRGLRRVLTSGRPDAVPQRLLV